MSDVTISLGAYKRSLEPEAILLNAFVEAAPTQQAKSVAIRARAGHSLFKTIGSAPLRGMTNRTGLFTDRALILMSSTLYLLDSTGASTALSGTVAGLDLVDMDMGQDADLNSEAWIATGSKLYRATDTTVTEEVFPSSGGAGASTVCCFRGFVLASETGTDQVFVRVPGDTSWVPLSFVSAEYSPDKVIAIRRLGEQIWFLGQSTAEAWALGGTANPPLEPYGGIVYDFGCRTKTSAVSMPDALVWVDDACQVRLTEGGAPKIISDSGLAEQIAAVAASDLRASWYQKDGHFFYHLTLQGVATWVYDLTTQQWHRRSTYGYDYSRISQFATIGDVVLAANSVANEIYMLDNTLRTDAGNTFSVEFTGFIDLPEGKLMCANLELICEVGNAPYTGQGSAPVIQMRLSKDNAKRWGPWRERTLGVEGASSTRVRWSGNGMIEAPYGMIAHFRVSDPVGRRFSGLRINVP